MPQLGETVTEGTITRWLKQVGDQVAADEPLFEVSTDKVDSEVPSPVGRRAGRDPDQRGRDRRRRHDPGGARRRSHRLGAPPPAAPDPRAAPEPAPEPSPLPNRSRCRTEPEPAPEPEPQAADAGT